LKIAYIPSKVEKTFQFLRCNCRILLNSITGMALGFQGILDALRMVFTGFRVDNLKTKIKPKKCFFFKNEIDFLGKKVNEHGVMIFSSK
jgi:hypothetical protein